MRKYQQLLLVTISALSIIVLFVYKSENNRLKDVLNVVNFFGRNVTNAKLESNSIGVIDAEERFMFTVPYPAWQLIGGTFYAYSAYWSPKDFRNEIGGEAIALVAAESVLVNFQCSLLYERKKRVNGKFRFERVANAENSKTGVINYQFFCHSTESGEPPKSVNFIDNNSKSKSLYAMKLRNLAEERRNSNFQYSESLLPTVCVDLVSNDADDLDSKLYEVRLLQFFMHYHIIGVRHFIVYNGDTLPEKLLSMLHQLNTQLHLLPFNFPFNTNTSGVRSIILRDCLMRTYQQRSRLVVLLKPNEFLYLNGQLGTHQSKELLGQSTRAAQLKLNTYSVCIDETHKLLMDSVHYDPEIKQTDIVMYRKHMPVNEVAVNDAIAVSQSLALAIRYTVCNAVGNDGLHDWQNSLREDFMQYVTEVRKRMQILL